MKIRAFALLLIVMILGNAGAVFADTQADIDLYQTFVNEMNKFASRDNVLCYRIQMGDVSLDLNAQNNPQRNTTLGSWITKTTEQETEIAYGKEALMEAFYRAMERIQTIENAGNEIGLIRYDELQKAKHQAGNLVMSTFDSLYTMVTLEAEGVTWEVLPVFFMNAEGQLHENAVYLYMRHLVQIDDGLVERVEWIESDQKIVYKLIKLLKERAKKTPDGTETDVDQWLWIYEAENLGVLKIRSKGAKEDRVTVRNMKGTWVSSVDHEYLPGVMEDHSIDTYQFDGNGSYIYYVDNGFRIMQLDKGTYEVEEGNKVILYNSWSIEYLDIQNNSFVLDGRTYTCTNRSVEDDTQYSSNGLISVAAGDGHSVGLRYNGTVIAVGNNTSGQMNVLNWENIVRIDARCDNTVGLRRDGRVVIAGDDRYGQSAAASWENVADVAVGDYHVVGLTRDGVVKTAGRNKYGQLNVDGWEDVVDVAAGGYHTLGLLKDGTVVAVGDNRYGQLNVEEWTDIIALAGGRYHTVGLKRNGTVVAVGSNDNGECNMEGWTDIVAIAAGSTHTVGLRRDGTVVAVGRNKEEQCDVGSWKDITAIACGSANTIGIGSDGMPVTVGWNYGGRLEEECR